MNPFAAFPSQPITLEIAGETLAITPIRVGEVPVLLATIQPFADQLASAEPDWLAILSTHGTSDSVILDLMLNKHLPETE